MTDEIQKAAQRPRNKPSDVVSALSDGVTSDINMNVPDGAKADAVRRALSSDDPLAAGQPYVNPPNLIDHIELHKSLTTDKSETTSDDRSQIEMLMKKDWTSIPKDELPEPPEGYEFSLELEGQSYVRRLIKTVAYEDLAYEVNALPQDAMYVDVAARNRGIYAEMDFRWLCEKNEFDTKMSIEYGFVPVKEQLDGRYRMEGGRLRNGDLYLAMRPKSVTQKRAREMAALNAELTRKPMDEFVEDESIPHRYGSMEGELDVKHGSETLFDISRNGKKEREANLREQMLEQSRSQNRGRRVYSVNAPFQRTIVNGKDIHPLTGAVGGN